MTVKITSLLALTSSIGLLSAASISVNFVSDRDNGAELLPAESAGAPGYETAGWNNFLNIPAAGAGITETEADIDSPIPGTLSDDSGSAVGTTITWSAVNSWNTNNLTANPDNKLMNGYIDNNAGSPVIPIDITGVPYANYTVVAYFGSDGNNRTGTIGISGGDTYSYSTNSAQAGAFPGAYGQTTDTGGGNPLSNFAVWENQTAADFTLTLTRGSSNSGVHGIQIIETVVPEPGSTLLIGMAGLLLLRRKR